MIVGDRNFLLEEMSLELGCLHKDAFANGQAFSHRHECLLGLLVGDSFSCQNNYFDAGAILKQRTNIYNKTGIKNNSGRTTLYIKVYI